MFVAAAIGTLSAGVFSAIVLGGIALSWALAIAGRARRERALLKAHRRAQRARGAAVEAGETDPLFAPEEIERSIGDVVAIGEALWRAGHVDALEGRADAHLIVAWARSREAWLGGSLEVSGKPLVDLLQVTNRNSEAEDRVIARVRLHVHRKRTWSLRAAVGVVLERQRAVLDERWTLGRTKKRWALLSVDGDPLAGPVLSAPLLPTKAYDLGRLKEESLAELANRERAAKDVRLSDLVAADAPPALALLDLSIVDGRFLPALIAAELAHMVEAWEQATTGSDAPLNKLASAAAVAALLRPAPDQRLIVRDAALNSWQANKLHLDRRPPAVEVALTVAAVRYVATAERDYLAGNADAPHRVTLQWLLELTESPRRPWRLAESNNPASEIPQSGWMS